MKNGLILLTLLVVAASVAESTVSVTFADGTKLTFDTSCTGPNVQTHYQGLVSGTGDTWSRVVSDKHGKVVFAYDVEASHTALGTFRIRIKPLAPAFAEKIQTGEWRDGMCCGKPAPYEGPIPTVASVRDFPEVKPGERVVIDILHNAATGDKIFDVLEPSVSTVIGGRIESDKRQARPATSPTR